ncbi:uncharacterized protein LOC135145258 [Zophobas morio]|uniref:uncharacterized protein LOC135145258 n=1 Tax=Zophobas morio TaxID=2755281 RepID=UPI0030831BBA
MGNKRSAVWAHFSIKEGDETRIICSHCHIELVRGKQGTTTHLLRHLQRRHANVLPILDPTIAHKPLETFQGSESFLHSFGEVSSSVYNHVLELLLIQTGGTIDKIYSTSPNRRGLTVSHPAISKIFSKLKLTVKHRLVTVCKRDDSNFTQDDLNSLKNSCLAAPEMKIIVTHGTETLIKTAQFLALESELEQNKLIILTGSFVPHQFKNSDAEFNIGLAVGASNLLSSGVFIAMNGVIIPALSCTRGPSGLFFNASLISGFFLN